ncbi:class I SAM-dependent methyltransferase [Variovorax sp. J22P240]|uniref:class I SAM-dependent methyltransferase n=1 Tax=Variovorax sp. J22P240 TaxID=3053514 RepID=UPI002578C6B5|nr:class I SAM-dependent methyltransferase [Variovorax sp. J22P240]MDM0001651.1 class I SAM-dependent methyltransferase [Variovorax sp. J22P240]
MLTDHEAHGSGAARVAQEVSAFYERHPYPPPVDDLESYRKSWSEDRRRAEACLFWPDEPYRQDRSILVAGCGTSQAAKHAMRWPRAKVVGIDVSVTSIEKTEALRRKHGLDNLELHRLPVERVAELGRTFEHVVCTGVLHHMTDPDAGLRALHDVLEPGGAMHLMVYAPYGRAGVYLLQDYCRRIGIGTTADEIKALTASLRALPPDHPLMPLLRSAPDFKSEAGIADALLHPQDRAYAVPQLLDFLRAGGFAFGRWMEQATYLPQCGGLASSAHHPLLDRLPVEQQYAAVELFRGSMVRHSLVAYRDDGPDRAHVDFAGDAWLGYVPLRRPDTVMVQERLQPGAAAVLINRHHSYTDLYLPITAQQKTLVDAIDGKRSIGEIAPDPALRRVARVLFEGLWWYDQVVFDLSRARAGRLM